jgi:ABC-type antimicrobial peptide transport system permease subunit
VAALAASATRIVRGIAPTVPLENVLTVAQIKDQSVAPRRLNAELISLFGILAVIIAAVGIGACWIPALRAARIDPAITMRG